MSSRSRPGKSKAASVWRVSRIQGSRAVPVTTVKAADAEMAVRRVIEDRNVTDPFEQRRLIARRSGYRRLSPSSVVYCAIKISKLAFLVVKGALDSLNRRLYFGEGCACFLRLFGFAWSSEDLRERAAVADKSSAGLLQIVDIAHFVLIPSAWDGRCEYRETRSVPL